MATSITTKGQVTVPKPLRDMLNLTAGSQVVFELAADGRVVMSKVPSRAKPPADRFARARGVADGGLSTDQILALMRGDD